MANQLSKGGRKERQEIAAGLVSPDDRSRDASMFDGLDDRCRAYRRQSRIPRLNRATVFAQGEIDGPLCSLIAGQISTFVPRPTVPSPWST